VGENTCEKERSMAKVCEIGAAPGPCSLYISELSLGGAGKQHFASASSQLISSPAISLGRNLFLLALLVFSTVQTILPGGLK